MSPLLIILSGLPGTGKSAIADGLAEARRVPVFSVDPIESAIIRSGIPASFATGLAAYLVAEALADRQLAAGRDALVDAVNSVEEARDTWRVLATKHGVKLTIIECSIADRAVLLARLAGRDRGLAIGEPRVDDIERRAAEWTAWPEPHLTLDGTDPLDANITRALQYVEQAANSA